MVLLSAIEHKRYKANCFCVTGAYHKKEDIHIDKITRYCNLSYGKNIQQLTRNITVNGGGKCELNKINLLEIIGNILMITTGMHESLTLNQVAICLVISCNGSNGVPGIVVLCLVVF